MGGQGASLSPASLGKLLQDTRDLNLPTLGSRPTRQALRLPGICPRTYTHCTVCLPVCLSACQPGLSVEATLFSCPTALTGRSCLVESVLATDRSCDGDSLGNHNGEGRRVQSACTGPPLIWAKAKSAFLQKPGCCAVWDGPFCRTSETVPMPERRTAAVHLCRSSGPSFRPATALPNPRRSLAQCLSAFGTARA